MRAEAETAASRLMGRIRDYARLRPGAGYRLVGVEVKADDRGDE